ncbi:hypothetical protein [Alphaproteobacteria bacterium endosymbiont of Tiliacea citrago]|uniref:hypothetical protein n=1 Tax=Alphaproteobacteria bacterium endosymbiont of Tiliacea citrago TaxID=3077944 RepID=UPI00313E49A7
MFKKYLLIFFMIIYQNNANFVCFLKQSRFNNRVKAKLIRIYHWSKLQKKDLKIKKTKLLLYPFGGGDLLYPLIFFPDIHEFIIIGLEPAGKIVKTNDSHGYISLNLRVLYEMGYFGTKQMELVFNEGMISLMNQQLIALKATNINIKFFEKGFTIYFKLNKKNKKVTYYSMNLSDNNEERWSEILSVHKNFTVFLKGVSYILQQKNFNKIRDFLISRSNVILQDDTGFSYDFLNRHQFKIYLFGNYFEPLESEDNFHVYFQENLMLAYLNNENINLFDISYNEENWLFALKK